MADNQVVPGSMSLEEFNASQHKLTSMSEATIELARLVLVDGHSAKNAAEAVGVSRQNVHKTVQRVVAAFNDIPSGYVELRAWMPKSMAIEINARLKALADQQKSGQ
jgi:predicted DNA-binding protein (UPF0251 family)